MAAIAAARVAAVAARLATWLAAVIARVAAVITAVVARAVATKATALQSTDLGCMPILSEGNSGESILSLRRHELLLSITADPQAAVVVHEDQRHHGVRVHRLDRLDGLRVDRKGKCGGQSSKKGKLHRGTFGHKDYED